MGRIAEAGSAFGQARIASPSAPIPLSEIEAVFVSQPSEVSAELFRAAKRTGTEAQTT